MTAPWSGRTRRTIHNVIRDLGSEDDTQLDAAILLISQLLDQEHQLASYEWTLRHPSWLKQLPADYVDNRPKQIRAEHKWALPRSLLGQRLRTGELEALRTALLAMLDRGKKPASVLFALGRAGGQEAIPRITQELRKQIGNDAWAVHQAVYTLDNLLYRPEGQRRLTARQSGVFQQACLAIREAATSTLSYPPRTEPGYVPDPRESAVQTLAVIATRFTPRRRQRELPRWSQGEYLVALVEATRTLPDGDVLVRGPLRMNLNQPQLRVHVNGVRPDGASVRAVLVGPYFNVSCWPPLLSIVLSGIAEADLSAGTRLFASGEEEAEVVRGMASGHLRSLPMFGEIQYEGLPPGDFIVANKSPDEVRTPEYSPEKAAIWQRTQEKLSQLQMARPRKRKPGHAQVRPDA